MPLTLSHQSALDAIRAIRAQDVNVQEMDAIALYSPVPWAGSRWSDHNFDAASWRWPAPQPKRPLHILVPRKGPRVRRTDTIVHTVSHALPLRSILWLDKHAAIVCPELLFLQMSEALSLPMLVMLGYELCGHFSRDAARPRDGEVTDGIPSATRVDLIRDFLSGQEGIRNVARAAAALEYVHDHALSVPEAILATIYSLPPEECGYGMGPIALNQQVALGKPADWTGVLTRYPDLMFSFAPVGINYDGKDHLDLARIVEAATGAALADANSKGAVRQALADVVSEVRSKVVDDNMRNRQLASTGRIVFSVTKEDLYGWGRLDDLTRQLACCARAIWNADVSELIRLLDDDISRRDRQDLLNSMLPFGGSGKPSYGTM